MFLTSPTPQGKGMGILEEGWPIVAYTEDPLGHGLAPKVAPTNAMVAFAEYLVCFVKSDAAEEDPIERPLVQYFVHEEVLPNRGPDTRSNLITSFRAVLLLCEVPHNVTIPLAINKRMGRNALNGQDRLIRKIIVNRGIKLVRDRGICELLSHNHPLLRFLVNDMEIELLKQDDPMANPTSQV